MAYARPANSSNPTLFVIVMDQSGSMAQVWAKNPPLPKSHALADIVNRLISELAKTCISGSVVKDRIHLSLIGYGGVGGTRSIWSGPLSGREVVSISQAYANPLQTLKKKVKIPDGGGGLLEVDQDFQVWITPEEHGGTPTAEALDLAAQIIDKWTSDPAEGGRNANSFPPIVCHVTDGMPNNEASARSSAQKLTSLRTSDGNVLLVNIHISDQVGNEYGYAVTESDLPLGDAQAKFLFDISSSIPTELMESAQGAGLPVRAGSRLMIGNADAVGVISLLSFASTAGSKVATEPVG